MTTSCFEKDWFIVPLDPASKALILKRQQDAGWDAPRAVRTVVRRPLGAASSTKSQTVDLLAAMRTNTQARRVLGIVATRLNQGYQAAETFPFSASHNLPGGADAKGAAIDLLNQANAYAQRVYATIPDNNAAVTEQTRKAVGIAVKNALRAVKLVSSAANNLNQGLIDDLTDYLITKAKDSTGLGIPRPVIYAAIAGAGILALFIVAKLVHTVMLGRAQLAEAEAEAIQIADSTRRKKAARKIATIS